MDHSIFKDDFRPTASIQSLKHRSEILQRLRQFFLQLGFFEVETPLLSHDMVVDRHLHPVSVDKSMVTGKDTDRGKVMWLQTSPEFGMKRLVAAGAEAVFQIGKAFRKGESGKQHNPEFTMLEWYRVGDDLNAGIDLLCQLVQEVLETGRPQRISYRDAFQRFANVDPFTATWDSLAAVAEIEVAHVERKQWDRDELLNIILSSKVEPRLGGDSPTVLYDYPASQSALARIRNDEYPVAERFELYFGGVELANGYHELLDADELLRRNQQNNQLRSGDGQPTLPEHSRLSAAMKSGMPSCSGTALGVDRLVMLALQKQTIDDVIAFPFDRA